MWSKLFGRKVPDSAPVGPGDEDCLVAVPIPPLISLLVALEKSKGEALTEAEVLQTRDKAVCMAMSRSKAVKMAELRGYRDLNPENVWPEWQEFSRQP
jgi:hypothetical protein